MIKCYKCYTENNEEDYCLELWNASTKHPDSIFYYSDWKDKSAFLETKFQIYQWLLYCASRLNFPFFAKELVDYATEHWYPFRDKKESGIDND